MANNVPSFMQPTKAAVSRIDDAKAQHKTNMVNIKANNTLGTFAKQSAPSSTQKLDKQTQPGPKMTPKLSSPASTTRTVSVQSDTRSTASSTSTKTPVKPSAARPAATKPVARPATAKPATTKSAGTTKATNAAKAQQSTTDPNAVANHVASELVDSVMSDVLSRHDSSQ